MAESKLNDSLSHCDCPSFTELLKGVMTATSTQLGFELSPVTQSELCVPHSAPAKQEPFIQLLPVTQSELSVPHSAPAKQEPFIQLSPVTQSELSVPHSAPAKQEPLLALQNNVAGVNVNQENCNHGTNYTDVVMDRPASDGYSWRKYGQKQVKGSQSSRSYYRCTICNCHAKKKVQRCDHSGSVIDIVYMGHHNHDPPQKKCTRSRRFVSSGRLAVGSDIVDPSVQKLHGSDSSIFWTDHRQLSLFTPESEQLSASSCDGNAGIGEQKGDVPEPKQLMVLVPNSSYETVGAKIGENHGVELKPKKRMKERGIAYSAPVFKTVKEPHIVVHAAGDVGVSSDGYRWRKYGQKMVKGNSHPRSYYRCTSAGCPVRKHVERATDDTTAIVITYEGKHDHDMPVPKKRHGAPSPALLVAATAPMDDADCKEAETLPNQNVSTNWPSDWTSEKALEHGDEKALESAQTLLSIGIKLGRC